MKKIAVIGALLLAALPLVCQSNQHVLGYGMIGGSTPSGKTIKEEAENSILETPNSNGVYFGENEVVQILEIVPPEKWHPLIKNDIPRLIAKLG